MVIPWIMEEGNLDERDVELFTAAYPGDEPGEIVMTPVRATTHHECEEPIYIDYLWARNQTAGVLAELLIHEFVHKVNVEGTRFVNAEAGSYISDLGDVAGLRAHDFVERIAAAVFDLGYDHGFFPRFGDAVSKKNKDFFACHLDIGPWRSGQFHLQADRHMADPLDYVSRNPFDQTLGYEITAIIESVLPNEELRVRYNFQESKGCADPAAQGDESLVLMIRDRLDGNGPQNAGTFFSYENILCTEGYEFNVTSPEGDLALSCKYEGLQRW